MRGIYEHKRCLQSVAKQPKRRSAFAFLTALEKSLLNLNLQSFQNKIELIER